MYALLFARTFERTLLLTCMMRQQNKKMNASASVLPRFTFRLTVSRLSSSFHALNKIFKFERRAACAIYRKRNIIVR
jgi:hypothetical protein